jgi:hypothetical protein
MMSCETYESLGHASVDSDIGTNGNGEDDGRNQSLHMHCSNGVSLRQGVHVVIESKPGSRRTGSVH